MIVGYAEAIATLKSSGFGNGRTDIQVTPWEVESRVSLPAIQKFHSAWLMYMDGTGHGATRNLVLSILSQQPSETEDWMSCTWVPLIGTGELNGAAIAEAVREWHRRYLGLSILQHRDLFKWAGPILEFFFQDRFVVEGGCTGLERWVQDCEAWFAREPFEASGLLGRLRSGGVSVGTCINVAMDSYEPLLNAIGSAVYLSAIRSEVAALPPRVVAAEVLRLAPPFRFINRVAADDKGCPRKTTIDLFHVNRDGEYFPRPEEMQAKRPTHLSFGFGRHACPGAKHALEVLEGVAAHLKALTIDGRLKFLSGELVLDAGYCRVEDLRVGVSGTS